MCCVCLLFVFSTSLTFSARAFLNTTIKLYHHPTISSRARAFALICFNSTKYKKENQGRGEILWGLVTEAESLVKKCNNLSVLYFILYSFFSIKSKWILLKCFQAAGSLLTIIAAGRPFFKSYKITVKFFESLGKNKLEKNMDEQKDI